MKDQLQQAIQHHRAGEFSQAEQLYRAILQTQPNHPDANHNLGVIFISVNKPESALPFFKLALETNPNKIEFWLSYIAALIKAEQFEVARDVLAQGRKLGLKGEKIEELARCLSNDEIDKLIDSYNQHNHVEAESIARNLLQRFPNHCLILQIFGVVLQRLGLFEESLAVKRKLVELLPDNENILHNLGNALQESGLLIEAEKIYRQAIAIKPDFAEAYNGLGNILRELSRFNEAEQSYRQAITYMPDFAEAYSNLGILLKNQGRFLESETMLLVALKFNPMFIEALTTLLTTYNCTDRHTPVFRLIEAKRFGEIAAKKVKQRFTIWQCEPQPKRLRVGFVSGDFRNHVVSYFLEHTLQYLQHANCDIIAYPTYHQTDEMTERIKPYFVEWKPIYGLSDEAAAKLIHNDGVHILVDLSGHSAHNRVPLFAWKPAPIQVTWLGYFATTGVAEMDYILGDSFVTPAEEAHFFTEKVWQLPDSYLCFSPPNFSIDVTPLPALKNSYITFGCFNNLAKMNDAVVTLWARVLNAVPNSKLFLKSKQLHDRNICENTRQRFASHGINAERLILEGNAPRADLLASYQRVDIALDPFPYPGGTTSVESLWMAVPVLTLRGECFLSHVGESIAHNAGLSDWIAADADNYVDKAIAFVSDLNELAKLRISLREQVLASPIFDAARFARNFENALWEMWYQYSSYQGYS